MNIQPGNISEGFTSKSLESGKGKLNSSKDIYPNDSFSHSAKRTIPESFSNAITEASKCIFEGKKHEEDTIPAEIVWSFQALSSCEHPPLIGPEGNIYVRASDEAVFALDATGKTLWKGESTASFGNRPCLDDKGNIYYIDTYGIIDGIRFLSYDSKGEKRWETKQKVDGGIGSYDGDSIPLNFYDNKTDSVIARFHNRVYSIDPGSGEIKWTFQFSDYAYGGIGKIGQGNDGSIYIAGTDGYMHVLDPGTGREIKKYKPQENGSFYGEMTLGKDGTLYAVEYNCKDQKLRGISANSPNGKKIWFAQGNFTGNPLPGSDNTLYIKKGIHNAYYICAIDSLTGQEKWTEFFAGAKEIDPIVAPDGSLIVKAEVAGKATRATAGKKSWSNAMGDDPVSRLYCLQPDGKTKWVMEPGFWIYTQLAIDEKTSVLYASDNGGGCVGINLDKISEIIEKKLEIKTEEEDHKPVKIEIGEDYVDVGGIRLPLKRA